MNDEYRIVNVPRPSFPMPPDGRGSVVKSCEHKYIFLEKRRIKDNSRSYYITKLVDVFYCEKCLGYKYKDC